MSIDGVGVPFWGTYGKRSLPPCFWCGAELGEAHAELVCIHDGYARKFHHGCIISVLESTEDISLVDGSRNLFVFSMGCTSWSTPRPSPRCRPYSYWPYARLPEELEDSPK